MRHADKRFPCSFGESQIRANPHYRNHPGNQRHQRVRDSRHLGRSF